MSEIGPKPLRPARPAHLEGINMLLVFLGGAAGVGLRQGLVLLLPPVNAVAYVIVAINMVGAFALGLLLEALVRTGEDAGLRRKIRLALGTGFIGGFTTYSTLSIDTVHVLSSAWPYQAFFYALGTVVLGFAAAWVGILVAVLCTRKRKGASK